jgi:hypothetical protein
MGILNEVLQFEPGFASPQYSSRLSLLLRRSVVFGRWSRFQAPHLAGIGRRSSEQGELLLAGLAELMGGSDKLTQKLDGIFEASSALPPDAPFDVAGLVSQYAHGNEPSHHIAYLYTYTGKAHKSQARLYSLMETVTKTAARCRRGMS